MPADLERQTAVQVVVLVRAELVGADVGLERLEVRFEFLVAYEAESRTQLRVTTTFSLAVFEQRIFGRTVSRRMRYENARSGKLRCVSVLSGAFSGSAGRL